VTLKITRDTQFIRADRLGVTDGAEQGLAPPEYLDINVVASAGIALVRGRLPGNQKVNAEEPWTVSVAELTFPFAEVRKKLSDFRSDNDAYLNAIDSADLCRRLSEYGPVRDWTGHAGLVDESCERAWSDVSAGSSLRALAVAGRVLFDEIFKPGSNLRAWIAKLPPGARLSVQWFEAGVADVPWGLMYALPASAAPEASGFLGLRYRLTTQSDRPPKVIDIALGAPDHAATAWCLFWGDEEATAPVARWHQQHWTAAPNRRFVPLADDDRSPKQALLELLGSNPLPAVLYFFCHHSTSTDRGPLLLFGDTPDSENVLTLMDLVSSSETTPPLVFANACGTGAETALVAAPIKRHFVLHGTGGFLGTEGRVPPLMASHFACAFYAFLVGTTPGGCLSAGEAVSQARMFLWAHYRNVGGLFYAYANEPALKMVDAQANAP
jgi:hypothetical protein